MARQLPGDLRGALKARAAQARYPFLAANLTDAATGRQVDWPHVRPSVLVDVAGVKVGIVGVMTIDALRSTIAANVQGLRIAPLESTVAAEGAKLRAAGAEIVIVAAHAGGRCDRFDQPDDLSSCDSESEIFQLARSVPHGLVDVIVAGHTHAGLAHQVDGIGIIQPYSRGQWFGRVDVVFDPTARKVARLQLFPPRQVCSRQDPATGNCAPATGSGAAAEYEGRPVIPDSAIIHAMEPELGRVHALQAAPLGVSLDKTIPRAEGGRSPLGNLVAEALRDAVPGADLAAINNAHRLWADLPGGALTFGQLYNVFPFDNRLARVSLTGAELSRWLANEIGRRGTVGISGVDVHARCLADGVHVDLFRGTERIRRQRAVARGHHRRADAQRQPGVPGFPGRRRADRKQSGGARGRRGLVPETRAADAERTRTRPHPPLGRWLRRLLAERFQTLIVTAYSVRQVQPSLIRVTCRSNAISREAGSRGGHPTTLTRSPALNVVGVPPRRWTLFVASHNAV